MESTALNLYSTQYPSYFTRLHSIQPTPYSVNPSDYQKKTVDRQSDIVRVGRVAAPRVAAPPPLKFWLRCTVENTANLAENEIVQLLSERGIFNVSNLGNILLLPKGYQIAMQLIDGMSGDCLLKSIGSNRVSMRFFVRIFFEGNFFGGDKNPDSMTEDVRNSMQATYKFSPQESMDAQTVTLVQWNHEMASTYANEDKRRDFECRLQSVARSIVGKLTRPSKKNRGYWRGIHEAVKTAAHELSGADKEKEFIKVQKRFPIFNFTSSLFDF
ncbi:MAG: hypothetical protein LBF49_02625 [Puniceicoccales bacterium]|jgi:hypothetical protein|nr:hypothetical protein [Puniceicoccales bacterium]